MPPGNIFHETDTLTFYSVCEEHDWLVEHSFRAFKAVHDLAHVMAVDADNFPSKTAVLLIQRIDVHDLGNLAINLQAIAVHNSDQIVELIVGSLHRGLPYLPFLLLAIAHNAK